MLELLIGTGWTFAAGFLGYSIASARYKSRMQDIENNLYYLKRYVDDSRKRLDRRRAEIHERYNNA
jgi:hypothetical protein